MTPRRPTPRSFVKRKRRRFAGRLQFGIDEPPEGTVSTLDESREKRRLSGWIHPGWERDPFLPLRPLPRVTRFERPPEPTPTERLLTADARKWTPAKVLREYVDPATRGTHYVEASVPIGPRDPHHPWNDDYRPRRIVLMTKPEYARWIVRGLWPESVA